MVVYGGDEVNAVVLSSAADVTCGGYAGEDTPKSVIPSSYAYMTSATDDSVSMQVDSEAVNGSESNTAPAGEGQPSKQNRLFGDEHLLHFKVGMNIDNPIRDGIRMYSVNIET